jgi:hypothetical protein
MANASGLRGANPSVAQCAADFGDAWTYWIDACQRGFLFLDVLQQRSERYREHAAKAAPHVLCSAVSSSWTAASYRSR